MHEDRGWQATSPTGMFDDMGPHDQMWGALLPTGRHIRKNIAGQRASAKHFSPYAHGCLSLGNYNA